MKIISEINRSFLLSETLIATTFAITEANASIADNATAIYAIAGFVKSDIFSNILCVNTAL